MLIRGPSKAPGPGGNRFEELDDELPLELQGLDPLRLATLRLLSATVLGVQRVRLGDRLRVGRDVVANHRLSIRGPGTVTIGDRANLYSFGTPTRLVTRARSARIEVGRNVRLTGAFLQAEALIRIGDDSIVARAHLLDSDMHSVSLDRRTNANAHVRVEPVIVERNVWIARGAAVLAGVTIGEGSVVAYGAVVTRDVLPGVLVAGNPAAVVRELE